MRRFVEGRGPSGEGQPEVDVRLLGPLEIDVSGWRVSLSARSARLFCMLALNDGLDVGTDRLIDELWEAPPQTARQQVHNAMRALRRALGETSAIGLRTTDSGYRLTVARSALDTARFRGLVRAAHDLVRSGQHAAAIDRYRAALDEWRGPALAGLDGRVLGSVAARLNEERLVAIEEFVALRREAGETTTLISDLMELVAAYPSREALRACLMITLQTSGRQADALAVFDEGRRWLADEFGLDPSPQMRELHGRILRQEALGSGLVQRTEAKDPDAAASGSSAEERRSFLPYSTLDFTGRESESEVLRRVATRPDRSALTIAAIDGMGGVGKTSLAIHIAHDLAGQYPDGQYFVDLRGFAHDVSPIDPVDALGVLLGQIGVPIEQVPADLDGRISQWRASTADRRALVLLDSAVDADQVRPLLPGSPHCLVLITSRRRLLLIDGVTPVSLGVLPQQDAVALFTAIVGTDRVDGTEGLVSEAVDLCGRLPLAIRIAAARFRSRRAWTLPYLLELLSDEDGRARVLDPDDRGVSSVIGLSLRHVSDIGRRCFGLLSLHPVGEFDAGAAAALCDIPVADAARVLEALNDDSLLLEDRPGRYRFHDLVRSHARQLLRPDEAPAAVERLVAHYTTLADRRYGPLARGPFRSSGPAVSGRCRDTGRDPRDEPTFHAVARIALETGPADRAWRLVCALQPMFRAANYGGGADELFRGALIAAEAAGDGRGTALCLTGLALALRERGDSAGAAALLQRAAAISERLGDSHALAYQLSDLGVARLNQDLFDAAVADFHRALDLAEKIGDDEAVASLHNNLGVAQREMGRLDESLASFHRAVGAYGQPERARAASYTHVNMGLVHNLMHRHASAAQSFRTAMDLNRSIGDQRVTALALAGLSLGERATGRPAEALRLGREALEASRNNQLIEAEADALNAIGEALLADGSVAAARETFDRARDFAISHHLRASLARALSGLGHVAAAAGDRAAAEAAWRAVAPAFPGGAADIERAERHLTGLGADAVGQRVTCLRCETACAVGDRD